MRSVINRQGLRLRNCKPIIAISFRFYRGFMRSVGTEHGTFIIPPKYLPRTVWVNDDARLGWGLLCQWFDIGRFWPRGTLQDSLTTRSEIQGGSIINWIKMHGERLPTQIYVTDISSPSSIDWLAPYILCFFRGLSIVSKGATRSVT